MSFDFTCPNCGGHTVTFWFQNAGIFNAGSGQVEPHPTEGESLCDDAVLECFGCRQALPDDEYPGLRDAVEDAFLEAGVEPK